jgi:hypothetical protein
MTECGNIGQNFLLPTENPPGRLITGAEMACLMNDRLIALLNTHNGGARPEYALPGTLWSDGLFNLYMYDGTQDVPVTATTRAVARTFYVTMDGSDSAAGTSTSAPFATVNKAIEAIQELHALQAPGTEKESHIVIVHPGVYFINPDTEIPENCAIYGYDLRVTKFKFAPQVSRQNNMFLMNSGIKVRGITFSGLQHEEAPADWQTAFEAEYGYVPTHPYPPKKGFTFVFKPGAFITRSPYIADCSQLHDFDNDTMTLPIDFVNDNPFMPKGGGNIRADGSVLAPSSPLRSVVVDSFTAINPNGIGYLIEKNAFVQLVSVFTNWSRVGLWSLAGGQMTVANSNNTFGDYAFASTGFRYQIEIPDGQIPEVAGSNLLAASVALELVLEDVVTQLMTLRYPGVTDYNTVIAPFPEQVALTERDTRTLLRQIIYDLKAASDKGNQYFIKGLFNWNAKLVFNPSLIPIFVECWNEVRDAIAFFLDDPAYEDAIALVGALIARLVAVVESAAVPANTLYRGVYTSVIEATGQQFSYTGSGVNYNALPASQRGVGFAPNPSNTILKTEGGRVYATFATEVGDTYLGEDLRVDFERNTIEGQAFSRGVQNIALPLIIGIGG